jgi:hypothetical protein
LNQDYWDEPLTPMENHLPTPLREDASLLTMGLDTFMLNTN